ncbi:universal stress protein [Actinoplanes sp. TBRC 11911]|uniref:universal stress protein n=1 Tax=Actinoplanes sp. TBRC 11911 TaxID=2729386 RepID=UPI00145E3CD5|nr:universal stress protein [Actinoplanes sp. TBRC 11911]NMO57282.1 universal stress protein [Actinoplanes sp. TBRC 11911]
MRNDVSVSEILPVVVGVDGSRTAPAAVDLAAAEAARHGIPLLIVHVWPGQYTGVFRSRGVVPSRADGLRLLEVSAGRARLSAPGLDIRTEMLDGGTASILTRFSERARLLVVGHRDDVITRPSWGSTTAYLAHHSACPLLVHRGVVPSRGPVVVATSARPAGDSTLGYAFAEAELLESRLVAVHMWTRPGAADSAPPVMKPGGYATERGAADNRLAEVLQQWSARFPGVPVDRLVVHDLDMAYTIQRASRRGRLLVAGIGESGRFAELLYGSANRNALHQATCPVALVPGRWLSPERPGQPVLRGRSDH